MKTYFSGCTVVQFKSVRQVKPFKKRIYRQKTLPMTLCATPVLLNDQTVTTTFCRQNFTLPPFEEFTCGAPGPNSSTYSFIRSCSYFDSLSMARNEVGIAFIVGRPLIACVDICCLTHQKICKLKSQLTEI